MSKSKFEGPLLPGRDRVLPPPRLRDPKPENPIRVPRSPKDLLPKLPFTDASKINQMLKEAEEKGYRRGYRKGYAKGFAAGSEAERKNYGGHCGAQK